MILQGLIIMLLVVGGVLMVKDKSRRLRPFDRATTDPMRGLLALLIVAHHTAGSDNPYIQSSIKLLGLPIVAVFFLLSGYGLCMSLKSKGVKYLDGFLKKRYSKLVPPLVALSCLSLLLAVYVDGKTLGDKIEDIKMIGCMPLEFSWFVFAICWVYLAFYMSVKIGKTLRSTGIIFIAFISVEIICTWSLGWFLQWYTTILAAPLGYWLALYEDRIERLIMRHTLGVYVCAVAAAMLTYLARERLTVYPVPPYQVWFCVWALCQAVAFYLIVRTLGTIKWKPLVWLGGISLEIYLVHEIVLKYIGVRIDWFTPALDYILKIIVVYTLSIFFAWLLHRIMSLAGRRGVRGRR